jgi:hypothetical protein
MCCGRRTSSPHYLRTRLANGTGLTEPLWLVAQDGSSLPEASRPRAHRAGYGIGTRCAYHQASSRRGNGHWHVSPEYSRMFRERSGLAGRSCGPVTTAQPRHPGEDASDPDARRPHGCSRPRADGGVPPSSPCRSPAFLGLSSGGQRASLAFDGLAAPTGRTALLAQAVIPITRRSAGSPSAQWPNGGPAGDGSENPVPSAGWLVSAAPLQTVREGDRTPPRIEPKPPMCCPGRQDTWPPPSPARNRPGGQALALRICRIDVMAVGHAEGGTP